MSQTTRRSTTGTPRWVKVVGIIAIALIVLLAVLHLTGTSLGGMHMMPTDQSMQQP